MIVPMVFAGLSATHGPSGSGRVDASRSDTVNRPGSVGGGAIQHGLPLRIDLRIVQLLVTTIEFRPTLQADATTPRTRAESAEPRFPWRARTRSTGPNSRHATGRPTATRTCNRLRYRKPVSRFRDTRSMQSAASAGRAPKNMSWIPGGTFWMGVGGVLSRGASGPPGGCRRVLDGHPSGDRRRVPAFREGHRLRHDRRGRARAGRVSRCRPGAAGTRVAGVHSARPARTTRRLSPVVVVGAGCGLAPSRGPRKFGRRPRAPSGDTRVPLRRARLRSVGGQGIADRVRVGVRGAGVASIGPGSCGGDEYTPPKGRYLANTWQGEFPWQNLAEDGYVGTSPRWAASGPTATA